MEKKKPSNYYRSLRYEQELAKKERKTKKEEPELKEIRRFRFLRIALLPNLTNLLLNNLCFVLTCVPVFLFMELTLQTGGLIFLVGVWLFMALLFPGLSALYHRSYDYTRRIAPSVRTSFFSFFYKNFKPAALTGIFLGFLWTLNFLYLLMGQIWMEASSSFYILVLFLLFLTSYYTVMVMVQLSLFELPLKAVFKNALLLIPSCSWRGLIPTILQLIFLLFLFQNLNLGLMLVFLGIPGILTSITSWLLWPRLSQILLREPKDALQDSEPDTN